MPPPPKVDVEAKTLQLDGVTKVFQCFCRTHLRFEAEYGLKRGTTTNSYLLLDGNSGTLVDVPRKEYLEVFLDAIAKETCSISTVVLTHLNPEIADTLIEVLKTVNKPEDGRVTLVMSNPALQVLRNKLGATEAGRALLSGVEVRVPRGDESMTIGRRSVRFFAVSTPRYPEMLCVYERTTRRLFSSCLFSAHVNPQAGAIGTDGTDSGGWEAFGNDWRFFFDCMFAPVAKQTGAALSRLNIAVANGSAGTPPLLLKLKSLLGMTEDAAQEETSRETIPVAQILPRHGPIIRQSVAQLVSQYGKWVDEQIRNASIAKVAVLYASAYGNTASLAQAVSRGITKAGLGVEMANLEQLSLKEAEAVLESSQGFVIGSPTLGGHMPTQVSAMLGSILRSSEAKALPCGVYGSYGWSGEAVDLLHKRLSDAGFQEAFAPIKVQFRPDAKALQVCEESGTDLAQMILAKRRRKSKSTAERSSGSAMAAATGAQQAMGRVVGSLCVVTAKDGDAESAMLASWISQASFDPPGITVSVKKDRAAESLLVLNNAFNINILAEGRERGVMKALLKPFKPGEDRFGEVDHSRSEETGCVMLNDAVSVLECRVADRLEAGDHWIVYGTVTKGKLLSDTDLSAVHHRKTGTTY